MQTDSKKPSLRFADLDLSEKLIKILTRLNFETPTPIQSKAIPPALTGKDIIGIAQTGTGKTLSFFLPMLQNLSRNGGSGLIVVPTRELAHQVQEQIERITQNLPVRTCLLIGGAPMDKQIRNLKKKPHIIIATPGRLNDHILKGTAKLHNVRILVLDEADRMFDMGFAPQIKQMLHAIPEERQTMLFSATMPESIEQLARKYMNDPTRIEIARAGTSAKNVEQGIFYVHSTNKFQLLLDLLNQYSKGPVLVFSRTKHGAKKMTRVLNKEGFKTEELHSNRSLNQRRKALQNFKTGKSRVMVATDVAARGIDVKEIELVINYDLPDQREDYVHRIGRTGRHNHKGHAVSFANPDQFMEVKALEKLVGKKIAVLELPGTMSEEEAAKIGRFSRPKPRSMNRGRSQRSNRGGRGRSRASAPKRQKSRQGRKKRIVAF